MKSLLVFVQMFILFAKNLVSSTPTIPCCSIALVELPTNVTSLLPLHIVQRGARKFPVVSEIIYIYKIVCIYNGKWNGNRKKLGTL